MISKEETRLIRERYKGQIAEVRASNSKREVTREVINLVSELVRAIKYKKRINNYYHGKIIIKIINNYCYQIIIINLAYKDFSWTPIYIYGYR
jgi:DNA invertase Pin-like site-specific DNA recombinase